ncbi:MAG: C25 family cysteine peptidase [bacterium]
MSVLLHVPPPGQLNLERLWWVDLANRSQNTYREVWLHGEVHEATRGPVYRANSNKFDLPPGRTTKRYRDIRIQDQWHARGYEVFIARSGRLPAGDYEFIVWLEPDLGSDTVRFTVADPAAPRLVSPRRGDSLELDPVFAWTRPRGWTGPVQYELRVVEVLPGQGEEEALRANQPWFVKGGIRATSLRYPRSARRLEKSKRYAWEVVAGFGSGIRPQRSENWSFTKFKFRPPLAFYCPLEVTRTVGRIGTFFLVVNKVRNKGGTTAKNVRLDVRSIGFQWVADDTTQSLWSTGDGTECRWSVTRSELPPGESFFAITMAVPVLCGPPVPQRVLWDSVRVECDIGANRVGLSPNLAWSDAQQINAAFSSADYLLITRPGALYGKHIHSDVHKVLSGMAALASRKQGVLGYVPTSWWRSDVKFALLQTSMWGQKMCPNWGNGTGYLLIVGGSDIIASFTPTTTWYNEYNGGQVRTSDFQFANLTGDLRPELRVGRLPGTPNDILPALKTALDDATPGQKAWLVGGPDGTWEPNVKDVEAGKAVLAAKGISTDRVHTEYVEAKTTQLHHAILIRLYENGTPADSALNAYLKSRTEYQYAVALLWLTGAKFQGLFNNMQAAIAWAVLLEGASTTKAQDIAQAITIAEGIQDGRAGRGGYDYPYTYLDPGVLYTWRNAMTKVKTSNRNIIAWEGHGNVATWGGVWDAPVNPANLSGRPVVMGFSCLTGVYQGVNGLPQSFLRYGAAAYLGATEVMAYARMTECMTGLFWKHWAKNKRIGDVLFDLQTDVLSSGITHEGNKYFVNQFNLYGDPKFKVWR